jgi:hypothetical protein
MSWERGPSEGGAESYALPRTIHEVDGSKPNVTGNTHSEMHLAASAQDSKRDAERRADLGRVWIFGVPLVEQALELNHDLLISMRDRRHRQDGTA